MNPGVSRTETAPLRRLNVEHPAGGFIRPYQRELVVLGRAIDLFWVIASLRVSMVVAGWDWDLRHTLLAAIAAILFYLSAEALNVYDGRRSSPLRFDLQKLLLAWTATAVSILFLGYALKVSDLYSRVAVITWFVLAPTALATWQVAVRTGLTKARTLGYNIRRVAIVGTGEQGSLQDLLAPVLGGAGGHGDERHQVAGGEAVGEEAAVLGLPQHGDRIDGVTAVDQ